MTRRCNLVIEFVPRSAFHVIRKDLVCLLSACDQVEVIEKLKPLEDDPEFDPEASEIIASSAVVLHRNHGHADYGF